MSALLLFADETTNTIAAGGAGAIAVVIIGSVGKVLYDLYKARNDHELARLALQQKAQKDADSEERKDHEEVVTELKGLVKFQEDQLKKRDDAYKDLEKKVEMLMSRERESYQREQDCLRKFALLSMQVGYLEDALSKKNIPFRKINLDDSTTHRALADTKEGSHGS